MRKLIPGRISSSGIVVALPADDVVVHQDAAQNAVVVGRHHAAFAAGDDLVELQAEGADVADAAESLTVVAAAVGLGNILQNRQLVLARDGHQLVHLARCAPHMNRDDGLRIGGDLAPHVRRVEGQRLVDLGQDGHGPHGHDR